MQEKNKSRQQDGAMATAIYHMLKEGATGTFLASQCLSPYPLSICSLTVVVSYGFFLFFSLFPLNLEIQVNSMNFAYSVSCAMF